MLWSKVVYDDEKWTSEMNDINIKYTKKTKQWYLDYSNKEEEEMSFNRIRMK